MATAAQMKALLAVPCPWCNAAAGQRCQVRIGSKMAAVPSTLDGESHDARWRKALSIPAKVMTGKVEDRRSLAASAAVDDDERPW